MAVATAPAKGKKDKKSKSTTVKDVALIGILDMSGSMRGREVETRGGWNSLLADSRKDVAENGGKVTVSLTVFDTRFIQVHGPTPVQDLRDITEAEYLPAGMTALYDAIGKTLAPLSFPKGEKVLVIITTDGEENSSQEWIDRKATRAGQFGPEPDPGRKVRELIESKEAEGWEFLFLGVGLDAWDAQQSFGTRAMAANSISTPDTPQAVTASMHFAGETLRDYRRGGSVAHSVAAAYAAPSTGLIDRSRGDKRPGAGPGTATPHPARGRGIIVDDRTDTRPRRRSDGSTNKLREMRGTR